MCLSPRPSVAPVQAPAPTPVVEEQAVVEQAVVEQPVVVTASAPAQAAVLSPTQTAAPSWVVEGKYFITHLCFSLTQILISYCNFLTLFFEKRNDKESCEIVLRCRWEYFKIPEGLDLEDETQVIYRLLGEME